VLLDEIGRGTSTYDGVSIAWSVSEHLHDRVGCKTVFATHYHELTQLADELSAARNFNVLVREVGDQVLFLHRLAPGGADRSYGIEVGRLAGLPDLVLRRAKEVLAVLEGRSPGRAAAGTLQSHQIAAAPAAEQLALFAPPLPHPIVERLKSLDPNEMTPLQAIALLAELAEEARRA
jgi:DNA mismatch repair protein MutS